jgi:outer membrane protein OmpA-like peptidoglycan-associated protein
MNRSCARVLMLVLTGLSAVPALGQEHTLSIGVAGEKFKLDPAFSIAIDGTVIGEGTVANALETDTGTRLKGYADPATLVSILTFTVPEGLLTTTSQITVRFSGGDSYDPALGADTNFYIASLAIDDAAIALDGATVNDPANPSGAVELVAGFLGLYATGATASFAVPAMDPAPVATAPEPAPVEPTEAPAIEAEPMAAATSEAEPVAAATSEPEPAAAPTCDAATTLDITGFGNNGLTLDDAAKADLDALVASLAGQDCAIDILGYASSSGSDSANARISLARAQLVQEHLTAAGIDASAITADGAGETRQFGDSQQSNRRVVVTVAATR